MVARILKIFYSLLLHFALSILCEGQTLCQLSLAYMAAASGVGPSINMYGLQGARGGRGGACRFLRFS